jgi:hypothetical protein
MARAQQRIWTIALLSAALLIVAGCGGSSSSDNPTASAPATSEPASTSPSTGSGSLADAEFCTEANKILKGLDEQLAPALDPSAAPANAEKTLKAIDDAYAAVIAIAPADIKPDLQLMSTAITELTTAYAKVNFDPSKALGAVIPLLNSQKLTEAAQHIGTWGAANCTNLG